MKVYSDVLGSFIEVEDNPKRIISLSPATTDALFSLGLDNEIVGVSPFCNIPPKAKEKPKVGSYLRVNYKLLDELDPDLILTTTGAQLGVSRELFEKGYPVYPFPLPTTVYGIIDMYLNIARIVGKTEFGIEKAKELSILINKLSSSTRKTVLGYYEIDLGGPITVGRFSYITHSLYLLGIKNIFSFEPNTYFQPDMQLLKKRAEEIEIIVYEDSYGKIKSVEEVVDLFVKRGLSSIKAIRENKVLLASPDTFAHYGPSHIRIIYEFKKKIDEVLQH